MSGAPGTEIAIAGSHTEFVLARAGTSRHRVLAGQAGGALVITRLAACGAPLIAAGGVPSIRGLETFEMAATSAVMIEAAVPVVTVIATNGVTTGVIVATVAKGVTSAVMIAVKMVFVASAVAVDKLAVKIVLAGGARAMMPVADTAVAAPMKHAANVGNIKSASEIQERTGVTAATIGVEVSRRPISAAKRSGTIDP